MLKGAKVEMRIHTYIQVKMSLLELFVTDMVIVINDIVIVITDMVMIVLFFFGKQQQPLTTRLCS